MKIPVAEVQVRAKIPDQNNKLLSNIPNIVIIITIIKIAKEKCCTPHY